MGGAVIMKFTQRSKPAPAPVAAAPAPVAAPIKPPAPPAPAPPVHRVRRAKAVRPVHPPVTIARNLPPAEPQPVSPAPAQSPVQESAPPEATEAPGLPPEPVESPAPPPAPSVTLRAGMVLPVRLGENLSSEHNQAGDTFTATLDAPLTADGFAIAERGARLEGRIVEAQKSTFGKGRAALVLELTRLHTSDGQQVVIQTETFRKQPESDRTQDIGVVAAAAGIGAIVGAMAGGGKGAGIGAAAGGAAGTGGVMATRAKAVSLPAETRLNFRLRQTLTLTERANP
jgi:hypothetical protein